VLLSIKYNPDGQTAKMLTKLPSRIGEENEPLEDINCDDDFKTIPDFHLRNGGKVFLVLYCGATAQLSHL
jgi:hypothetical protein